MKKLNVGCGQDLRKGWVNLDMHKENGADVIFDLNKIFKGKKMPFPDNHFDYVYCSHVLEDFIEPIPIMDELVRVCKKGGKIEIKTPFETSNWQSNLYHKRCFSLGQFKGYIKRESYGQKRNLEIIELKYYCKKHSNKILNLAKSIAEPFYNFLGFEIVENTFVKYLFPFVNCRVVYKKIK